MQESLSRCPDDYSTPLPDGPPTEWSSDIKNSAAIAEPYLLEFGPMSLGSTPRFVCKHVILAAVNTFPILLMTISIYHQVGLRTYLFLSSPSFNRLWGIGAQQDILWARSDTLPHHRPW